MIICHSKRYVYIHLHKCAGTSIEHALANDLTYNDLLIGTTQFGERMQPFFRRVLGLNKHSAAGDARRFLGEAMWRQYFSFATVRNPYGFVLSQYRYSKMNLRRALKKIDKASVEEADPALLQSLRDTWPWSYPGVRALLEHDGLDTSFSTFIRASALSDWHGFQPLAPQLCDEGGEFIVRKIIKLEELEKEWPPLLESLGIPERPLATRNASRSENEPPPNDISEPGDIAFIRDRFEIDFRRLGYHPDDVPAGV